MSIPTGVLLTAMTSVSAVCDTENSMECDSHWGFPSRLILTFNGVVFK